MQADDDDHLCQVGIVAPAHHDAAQRIMPP